MANGEWEDGRGGPGPRMRLRWRMRVRGTSGRRGRREEERRGLSKQASNMYSERLCESDGNDDDDDDKEGMRAEPCRRTTRR